MPLIYSYALKKLSTCICSNFKVFTPYFIRNLSSNNGTGFMPFLNLVKARQLQAKRSILVQVQSSHSYKELYSYCSKIGNVTEMLHYTVGIEPLHFIIVEFEKETDVESVLSIANHVNSMDSIPIVSQFLWFRTLSNNKIKLVDNESLIRSKLSVINGNNPLVEADLLRQLAECTNISDQMRHLFDSTYLKDLGTRLRYLTARQVELSVKGLFPQVQAVPFGSSVNGFGREGCDLDLVLHVHPERDIESLEQYSRLVFHCKEVRGSERSAAQRNVETIADIIQLFLPGCSHVRKILPARIPIIKYCQQFTDVECDLSMSNMSGVYMSDFLYMMGEHDNRVRPLIFTIRKWASAVAITNSLPGRWITNFSLTLLVLSYLQRPHFILPSLNSLIKLAGPGDQFITEDGIVCTFARDITKVPKLQMNKSEIDLETLLIGFFEYYSKFDFASKAISLNDGEPIPKPEHAPMYIVNPLEKGLNVSRNVSFDELERFQSEARNALWILQSQSYSNHKGLIAIYDQKTRINNVLASVGNSRLMDIRSLFEETEQGQSEANEKIVKPQKKQIKKQRR